MASDSIFTFFLSRLNVKHTQYYAEKLFNEHPDKYNLFGLSDMLTTYGVENTAFEVERKADIYMASPPFVAHVGGDFVLVEMINKEQVRYIWKGKQISVPTDEFIHIWTGVLLVAEPNELSGEPDYQRHRKKENTNKFKNYTMGICLTMAFFIICALSEVYVFTGLLVLLLLNLAGIYIGYLLLLKHLHIREGYGDRICSLFKQTDCNNILESEVASLFGIISWSEIGLSYFISNLIIILFFPHLYTWMVLINICALPYSFWSIWYQGVKAKQWCPLCIIVQVLLWLVFFVGLGFGFVSFPAFNILQVGIVACVYLIPLLVINMLSPLIANKRQIVEIKQEMNSMKSNENVFVTLLKEQPGYDVSIDNSRVLLGNSSANLFVTVLTNPHCNPCSNMHKRISRLLKKTGRSRCSMFFLHLPLHWKSQRAILLPFICKRSVRSANVFSLSGSNAESSTKNLSLKNIRWISTTMRSQKSLSTIRHG